MPWKETCTMDERVKFIGEWLSGEYPMRALCEAYGISRKTAYKWAERYRSDPEQGLLDRSRAPHHRPHAIDPAIAEALIGLRRRRHHWGPRKLLAYLERDRPEIAWPAASTVGDLLRRAGLVEAGRRRRSALPVQRPFLPAAAANDIWCADFKGWFRTSDGTRCDPLTISDAYSRYLLECRIVKPTGEGVRPRFERAFRTFGLPRAIRTDNGTPFASSGPAGLTRLSVHWVKLGIKLERIEPGQPQQNATHERMHRTLKAETSRPPASSPAAQQRRFDSFCQCYNQERPHEALGQQTPASRYTPSARPYPSRIEDPWYDADHAVRRIRHNGEIKWQGDYIFISESLVGELVGIAETHAGNWIARFADLDLGIIDRKTRRLHRFSSPRPGRADASERTGKSVTYVPGPNCHL